MTFVDRQHSFTTRFFSMVSVINIHTTRTNGHTTIRAQWYEMKKGLSPYWGVRRLVSIRSIGGESWADNFALNENQAMGVGTGSTNIFIYVLLQEYLESRVRLWGMQRMQPGRFIQRTRSLLQMAINLLKPAVISKHVVHISLELIRETT